MRHPLTVKELIDLLIETYEPETPVVISHDFQMWPVMGLHNGESSRAVIVGWSE